MHSKNVYIAKAPSNIAFLKYWGKRDETAQWPTNDSLSMTLSKACTTTRARCVDADDFRFTLNDTPLTRDSAAGRKIFRHLDRLALLSGVTTKLDISSYNSFPTGSGIASSASGFAALTLCALGAFCTASNLEDLASKGFDRERLANLSRLGSGSACRSLYGGFVQWEAGDSPQTQRVAPLYEANHWLLGDLIVILESTAKTLSSTEGHRLATSSPLFAGRLQAIPARLAAMREAIRLKDISHLGTLIEEDALEMHAIIESSLPGFSYFSSVTRDFLEWLRAIRQREGLAAFFTCDAGANVHVIGEPKTLEKLVKLLQEKDLRQQYIMDAIGTAPLLAVEEA